MKKELMNKQQVDKVLKRLASEIVENYESFDDTIIIGIRTRGYFLAQRIKEIIDKEESVEIPLGAIDITFYRDDLSIKFSHPSVEATDIPISLENKKVILVDDVLYTGRTIRAAMDVIFDFGRPSDIKVVSLIDRPSRRELPILSNFTGKSVELLSNENVRLHLQEVDGVDNVSIEENQ